MPSATRPCAISALLVLLMAAAPPAAAAKKKSKDEPRSREEIVQEWLVLGPVAHPRPVFSGEDEEPDLEKILGSDPFSKDWPVPAAGVELTWFDGRSPAWTPAPIRKRETVALTVPDNAGEATSLALMAAYVTVDRWVEGELELLGSHSRCAWIDGEPAVKCGAGEGDDEDDRVADKVKLTPGTHRLLVLAVHDPGKQEQDWSCGAKLLLAVEEPPAGITLSTGPERTLDIRDLLDPPYISSLAVSPDGKQLVLSYKRFVPGTNVGETWIEIRSLPGGDRVRSWRQADGAGNVGWSDDGRYISFVSPGGKEGTSTLYLVDQADGRTFPLLDGVEKFGGYLWSPGSRVMAYWTTEEHEKDERGVKRVEGLMDRWAGFRDKQYLHLVTVPQGLTRRLTTGDLTTSALGFAPDGGRMLFSRHVEDLAERPYSRTELWEMDLESFETTRLRDFRWFNGARYSPDGSRLLVHTAPDEFENAGVDVPQDSVPNSYDSQLYIWDPRADEVEAISKDFDPAVLEMTWNRHDGQIYVIGEDRDFRKLYRYEPAAASFTPLDVGFEVVRKLALAARAPVGAAIGSGPWAPQGLVAIDSRSGGARRLEHPSGEWIRDVRTGAVESWSFTASSGREIDGRVYLPPDFDPQRRYPAIVYYYGGTSPVRRDFGGRYPKEWWAANGYVVYVLQPSGATGYGQPFSALHVNDWGARTSTEVVEGTEKFLEAHPYVDPKRVGCIGASYGGFLTMLLVTKTDLFAAAVSHAGISSISSYWGEGYWGYGYNAVSAAESFPWNRKDIYVEQSPLFRANEAQVPILLTHGQSDTNVPVGESDALYIALKLLDKPVEYVQIEGQDHWIADHDKRIVWSRTIVAWFDRWLKGRPEWWDAMYPEDGEEESSPAGS